MSSFTQIADNRPGRLCVCTPLYRLYASVLRARVGAGDLLLEGLGDELEDRERGGARLSLLVADHRQQLQSDGRGMTRGPGGKRGEGDSCVARGRGFMSE